jgi:predicted AAA+ superfamily ATPase
MDSLLKIYHRLVNETQLDFYRYLYQSINWNNRLIGIVGARGTGKTTLLLQRIKNRFPNRDLALYASLDNIWFASSRLIDLAEVFYNNGGTHLFLDEVHRYKGWATEIKNIYDSYPKLNIIFTGSSLLEINKSSADLSRRAICYSLSGLSFREFLLFENYKELPVCTIEDIVKSHQGIAEKVTEKIRILPEFKKYLSYGYYPFYKEGVEDYCIRVLSIINLILDNDIPAVENIEFITIQKIKKLLMIISSIFPFSPNIAKLSNDIDSNRNDTLKFLKYLQKAALLNLVHSPNKSMTSMSKPDKVYVNNSNLMYALSNEPNTGNVRETFFVNQLMLNSNVTTTEKGDFIVNDKLIFEIGGKSKSYSQIKNIVNSYIAADDLEIGYGNKIPLWLFGFLY